MRNGPNRWDIAALLFAASWLAIARGQPPLPTARDSLTAATVIPLDSAVRAHWDRAESLVETGPADEAIEALRRVIDSDGARLLEIPVLSGPPGFSRFVPLRELAWARIGRLAATHPTAFTALQRRLDSQAKQLLALGVATRDEAVLRRVVDELFISSQGDDALWHLGEAALERGEFNAARRDWERLAPGLRFPANDHPVLRRAANCPLWLPLRGSTVTQTLPTIAPLLAAALQDSATYPNTDRELGAIRARLAIVSILEGNEPRARIELDLLRHLHPNDSGTIAGRTGNLAELVDQLLRDAKSWTTSRSDDSQVDAWTVGDAPLWSVSLPRLSVQQELLSVNRVRVADDVRGLLSYRPVIAGESVIVQTGPTRNHVQVFRLRTGEPTWSVVGAPPLSPTDFDRRNVQGVPRFAPSSAGQRLLIVGGLTQSAPSDERLRQPARLEALDLDGDRRLLWEFAPRPPAWSTEFSIAGPAVHDGARWLVPLLRRTVAQWEAHVAALDPLDGRELWTQFLCAAEPPSNGSLVMFSHNVLTVDQSTVYCNTNLGMIAALDTRAGRVLWQTTYPRTGLGGTDPDRNDLHWYRDLNACLVHRDLVIVAPTDCNRLFALDATNGLPIWVTPEEMAADAVHLLGVRDNWLIASGESLYWFDTDTGQMVGRYPAPFKAAPGFARPSPRGMGRGLLLGSRVLWPTDDGLAVFNATLPNIQSAQDVVRPVPVLRFPIRGGNLASAHGVLLVAGADHLTAFAVERSP